MKEARLFFAPQANDNPYLPDEEAGHALRVLRLKEGDNIYLTDGKGYVYEATISPEGNRKCSFTITKTTETTKGWNGRIHLAMAPTKNMDRTEWLAEKATEIGFDELTMLDCAFSERKVVKCERIEKILIAAMKQSHKATLPTLNGMTKFNSFINTTRKGLKFIAHCYNQPELNIGGKPFLLDALKEKNPEETTILIGPEGDFSVEEVKQAISKGYQPISLGNSRLRTETAALAAVHIANIYLNKKENAESSAII